MVEAGNDRVKHVIVLALENHSFDQMLGCFKAVYPGLEGVNPAAPHANTDDKGVAYPQKETRERQIPDDPHHEVTEVAEQLANGNGGFVRNFVKWYPNATAEERGLIMGYYPLDFLPALHPLARHFTICDHWFLVAAWSDVAEPFHGAYRDRQRSYQYAR
jgi:phospholipase C